MKNRQLQDILKTNYLTIPVYLFKIKKILKINSDSFLVLIYLLNNTDNVFNPIKIKEDLKEELEFVMNAINDLTTKKLINIEVKKNEKGILEEYINIDIFYEKINNLLISDEVEEEISTDIYASFEQEFGRCLSPMEYEIINAWLDQKMNEELIIEALKEAVMNGAPSLKYIDKILYDWDKKGYKNKKDIDKSRIEFRKKQEKNKARKEVFDYNWLEDTDDE